MLDSVQLSGATRAALLALWVVGGAGLAVVAIGAAIGYDRPLADGVKVFSTALYLVPAALCLMRAVRGTSRPTS